MSTIKYANAVAAISAMENTLLSRSDIEQLINCATKAEFENLIASKRGGEDFTLEGVWEMLRGYAPECKELEILLYKNDFHNLKAALKSKIAGKEPEGYYIRPTNLDLKELYPAVSAKEYEALPEYIRSTAEEAYELLTRTLDGQLADSLIDTAAMQAMRKAAEKCGSDFIKSYVELTIVCADIKTAYRCAKMKKQRSFLEMAICGSAELDKDTLVRAALGGAESVLSCVESSSYAEAAKLLAESPAQFEKWCDDVIMELAETARMQAFGAEPLAAYYIAAEAELKDIRILSVCRESGTDKETMTERMRKLYV